MELDDTEFDFIVAGTNLVECVLSGALARAGKKVLHLEDEEWYGGHQWATLALHECRQWAERRGAEQHLRASSFEALGRSRDYSLDVLPVPILAAGPLVALLLRSSIGRYLEFKVVDTAYLFTDGALQPVPCSKGDVFKSKVLAKKQKGQLMSFMRWVLEATDDDGHLLDGLNPDGVIEYWDRPFADFLSARNFPEDLQQFIRYAIALEVDDRQASTTGEALRAIKAHLNSVGKYGPTAFLYNMYGAAEVPQAFARVCAIYGGTYVLRRGVAAVLRDEAGLVRGVRCTAGQELRCKYLVGTRRYLRLPSATPASPSGLWRVIAIVSSRLLKGREEEEEVLNSVEYEEGAHSNCIGIVPPGRFGNEQVIHIVQLSHSTKACPKGAYVLHFTTVAPTPEPLRQCIARLLDLEAPVDPAFSLAPPPPPPRKPATPPGSSTSPEVPVAGESGVTGAEPEAPAVAGGAEAWQEPPAGESKANPPAVDRASVGSDPPTSSSAAPAADPQRPQVLYYALFNLWENSQEANAGDAPVPANLIVVPEADGSLCQHSALEAAEALFRSLMPQDVPYFERLPDPYEQAAEAAMVVTDLESQLLGVERLPVPDAPAEDLNPGDAPASAPTAAASAPTLAEADLPASEAPSEVSEGGPLATN